MGDLLFTSRRALKTVGSGGEQSSKEVTVVLNGVNKKYSQLSARLASVQRRLNSETMDDIQHLRTLNEARELTAKLAETAARRRLASRGIDQDYSVRVTSDAA